MKKITNLLIVASLALAGAVMAQQPTPEESQAPGTTKKQAPEKKPRAEKPAMTQAPKTEAPALKEPALKETPSAPKMEKSEKKGPSNRKSATSATAPDTNLTEQPATTPADKKQQSTTNRKDKK